jgi:hypothetical protein
VAEFLLSPAKDTSARRTRPSKSGAWTAWKQAKTEHHLIGGFSGNQLEEFRSLIQFTIDWSNVLQFQRAELWLYTSGDHGVLKTAGGTFPNNIKISRKPNQWFDTGGGEEDWTGAVEANDWDVDANYDAWFKLHQNDGTKNVIVITNIVSAWVPKTVKLPDGTPGKGLPNTGLVLTVSGSGSDVYERRWIVASDEHPSVGTRPILRIVYTVKGGTGLAFADSPVGDVAPDVGLYFEGHYEPGLAEDHLSASQVRVLAATGGAVVWDSGTVVGGANDTETNTFSVPAPASLKSQTFYDWEARVKNQKGAWTPWTPKLSFRKLSDPPSLSAPAPSGTFETLAGVTFQATYSDPDGNPLSRAQVQVRGTTPPGDPLWESGGHYWDSGLTPVSASESQSARIRRLYQGPGLTPGSYSYRLRAADQYDATSAWVYGTFTLTKGYEPSPGEILSPLTGYDRRRQRFRIRIFGMGTNRAPGVLVAELYDAANVGASEYYNSAGEFFFTLPATHPQVAGIEPFQTHFSLELYRGEGWKPILNGLMTDFDATEDEVVFYGIDYVGVLAMLSDERYNASNPDLPVESGGAKYVDDTIDSIITDQLTRAKNATNSPVKFITVGDISDFMTEKVTIITTFKERLSFIAGLIDSHRAGTGRRTRLLCHRAADGSFSWRVPYDPGQTRDNLRLEYGGLIQGFQVIPFGQWGTKVHGIGRTSEGVKPFYAVETGPGIDETVWGSFPRVNVFADLEDSNDLIRRTRQAAIGVAKVGKRMALGIRVDSLDIKDGWDICDSIPVHIKRGVVDTTRYGSGYWTIWGWSWQSYPDGHTDTNLTILPREDTTPLDPDLIPSVPILDTPEWGVDARPPTVDDPEDWWLDTSDGSIWVKDPDGTWSDTGDDISGPPGPPGPAGGGITYLWNVEGGPPPPGHVSLSTPLLPAGTLLVDGGGDYLVSDTDPTAYLTAD